jgi:uncharacterized protein YhbP (UPF0306 family)
MRRTVAHNSLVDTATANDARPYDPALGKEDQMAIRELKRPVAAARLSAIARELLAASSLCAIATIAPGGRAHINTAYFAWTDDFELVWLSEPRSRHSRNLLANPTAALAVYDSAQSWGGFDRGIQLFGRARHSEGRIAERAFETYAARFPNFREGRQRAYALYLFRPRRLKLFDEQALGGGTFVTAAVSRGRLAWESTEVFGADD